MSLLPWLVACTPVEDTAVPAEPPEDDPASDCPIPMEAHPDRDGDGFGAADEHVEACELSEGWVEDGSDCDDSDASVSPDADEHCDARDEDCDGRVDEDVEAAPAWHVDADGDGFGDPDDATLACTRPDGHVSDASDCDDAQAEVNPAADEQCANGLDDDCDAETDCRLLGGGPLADAGFELAGAVAGDQLGYRLARGGDLDGDGAQDLLSASPVADRTGDNAGAAWVIHGPLTAPATLDDALTFTGEEADDQAGYGVAGEVDVDGDGLLDVLVGASYRDELASNGGTTYLLSGPATGGSLGEAIAQIHGSGSADLAGIVCGLGDQDGDGFGDFAIGAPSHEVDGTDRGAVFVFRGPVTGSQRLTSAYAALLGPNREDNRAGFALASGDHDGDGVTDLAIGAYDYPNRGGMVFLVDGPAEGSFDLERSADADLWGPSDGADFGWSLELGDVDADGHDDLLVGARDVDDAGGAYLYLGPLSGTVRTEAASAQLLSADQGSLAGWDVALPGDVDGDGPGELVVGVPEAELEGVEVGAIVLAYGPVSGVVQLQELDARRFGSDAEDAAGRAVVGADVDGDGRSDLLVGVPGASGATGNGGAIFVLAGLGP